METLKPPQLQLTTFAGRGKMKKGKSDKEDSPRDKAMDARKGIKEGSKQDKGKK